MLIIMINIYKIKKPLSGNCLMYHKKAEFDT